MHCSREQFSFQMCLEVESGDGSRTFRDREFQTAGQCRDTEWRGLENLIDSCPYFT